MNIQMSLTLGTATVALILLTSCGESEKPVPEPVSEKREEPVSLVGNRDSSSAPLETEVAAKPPEEPKGPEEDDLALLALETTPKSMEDFESSIQEVAEQTEPRAAARQLRQAAAFIRSQSSAEDQSEQSRLSNVETHLRAMASKLDAAENADDMGRVIGQLQGMMEMYMP